MSAIDKKDVAEIYPLTTSQELLLSHSLIASEDDGFLQVECTLEGKLDFERFKVAWDKVVQRHEALRSTVHWEKIAKPVRIVHHSTKSDLSIERVDFESLEDKKHQYLLQDRSVFLDLRELPTSRIHLIQYDNESHLMVWTCHHLLLDGWSTGVILKDLLSIYSEKDDHNRPLPQYKEYLAWVRNQDADVRFEFWKGHLQNVTSTRILKKPGSEFKEQIVRLDEKNTEILGDRAKSLGVTLNLLMQAIWGILLNTINKSEQTLVGSALSGRTTPEVEKIDQMAGMFMNVLPMFISVEAKEQPLKAWLQDLLKLQNKVISSEHLGIQDIEARTGVQGVYQAIESLFVFENFPLADEKNLQLRIAGFRSRLTTNYPLSLAVVPGKSLEICLKFDLSIVNQDAANWLSSRFKSAILLLNDSEYSNLGDLLKDMSESSMPKLYKEGIVIEGLEEKVLKRSVFKGAENDLQVALKEIWEEVLEFQPIGIEDDFFEIGGSSFYALRLFTSIKQKLKVDISPSVLLHHRTIRAISALIEEGETVSSWSSLVPLQTKGDKPPLFLVHAGGAHVLFYKSLMDQIGEDQPVYAIQPKGLSGKEPYHRTVEEMAVHYWEEIKKRYPKGEIGLLGYCHSNPVCIEMARLIKNENRDIAVLAAVDAPPNFYKAARSGEKVKQLIKALSDFDISKIWNAVRWRVLRKLWKTKELIAEKPENRRLIRSENALRSAFARYQWHTYKGDLVIFQSEQHKHLPEKQKHVELWKELVHGEVKVVNVPGSHYQIFQEPGVSHLVKALLAEIEIDD